MEQPFAEFVGHAVSRHIVATFYNHRRPHSEHGHKALLHLEQRIQKKNVKYYVLPTSKVKEGCNIRKGTASPGEGADKRTTKTEVAPVLPDGVSTGFAR